MKTVINNYNQEIKIGDIVAIANSTNVILTRLNHISSNGNFIGTPTIAPWSQTRGSNRVVSCGFKCIISEDKLKNSLLVKDCDIIKLFKDD